MRRRERGRQTDTGFCGKQEGGEDLAALHSRAGSLNTWNQLTNLTGDLPS